MGTVNNALNRYKPQSGVKRENLKYSVSITERGLKLLHTWGISGNK